MKLKLRISVKKGTIGTVRLISVTIWAAWRLVDHLADLNPSRLLQVADVEDSTLSLRATSRGALT